MTSALPRANTVILIGQLKAMTISNEALALSIETAEGVVNTVLVVSAPTELLAKPLKEGMTLQVTGFLLPSGSKQQVVVSRERGHDVRILGAEAVVAPVKQAQLADAAPAAPATSTHAEAPSRSLGLRGLAARSPAPAASSPAKQEPSLTKEPQASPVPKASGLGRLARQATARPEANDEPMDFPGDSQVPVSAYEDSLQQQSRPGPGPGYSPSGRRNAPTFAPSDRDQEIPW